MRDDVVCTAGREGVISVDRGGGDGKQRRRHYVAIGRTCCIGVRPVMVHTEPKTHTQKYDHVKT